MNFPKSILSENKGLSDEEILNYGFSIEDISKECGNGGFGLTTNVSNQTLEICKRIHIHKG
jgi:hypothetical protein